MIDCRYLRLDLVLLLSIGWMLECLFFIEREGGSQKITRRFSYTLQSRDYPTGESRLRLQWIMPGLQHTLLDFHRLFSRFISHINSPSQDNPSQLGYFEPVSHAKLIPWTNAHNSASSTEHIPRFSDYPWTHPPSSFLRTPSAPALIVSLCIQPSVLSFIHPLEGFFHPTQISLGMLYLPNTMSSFEKAIRDSRNFLLTMSAFHNCYLVTKNFLVSPLPYPPET